MEALGIILAVLVGLFILAVIGFTVFVFVQVFKGFRKADQRQAQFEQRFRRNFDKKPHRPYK